MKKQLVEQKNLIFNAVNCYFLYVCAVRISRNYYRKLHSCKLTQKHELEFQAWKNSYCQGLFVDHQIVAVISKSIDQR